MVLQLNLERKPDLTGKELNSQHYSYRYLIFCLVFVNSAKNRVKAICNKVNFIARLFISSFIAFVPKRRKLFKLHLKQQKQQQQQQSRDV